MPDDIGADDSLSLKVNLDRSRTELLDLTGRNRLLNVPLKSKNAKTIEVVDELSSEIFRILAAEERAMTFAAGRRAAGSSGGLDDQDEDEINDLAQPEDESFDERGVAQRHSDTKLQTRLTSEGLQKRLLSMHYDARTLQEEQGVNILFLALGMLKWFEDANSDKERYAPLILIPVSLERGTAAEKFKLRRLPDDLAPNLSLEALLKRQFGLNMPDFGDGDQSLDPTGYFARVAETVSGQPRWEVVPNDIVLGFFSYAKFLMYRDLDAAMWPAEGNIEDHPVIEALFGGGFEGDIPLIREDEPIDPHIPPASQIHIMDADSSQTVAIHETMAGRHLVIQGPPGTGKSQTIGNIVAAAVTRGKKVLFVAEKMAALEVVKRRLDNNGVGDICLELHSHKANKRSVLAELRRTWDLGKPNGAEDGALIRQLTQYRDELNNHVVRLHRRLEPCSLTPYQVIGHMVKLKASGQPPADAGLKSPEIWTKQDKEDRELRLTELAARIEDMGLPADHPWRGVRLPHILPNELHRLLDRIRDLRTRIAVISAQRNTLQSLLGIQARANLAACKKLAKFGKRVSVAPHMPAEALTADCWTSRTQDISQVITTGESHAAIHMELNDVVLDAAWDTALAVPRQNIAIHGERLFRFLSGDYKRAMALLKSVLTGPPPKVLGDKLKLIDKIIAGQKAARTITAEDALGKEAFQSVWRAEKSDWPLLRRAASWIEGNPSESESEIRRVAAAVQDRQTVDATAHALTEERPGLLADLIKLCTSLDIDLAVAFSADAAENIDLDELCARFDVWLERPEDLSKWIAYKAKADQAVDLGLASLVERLVDARLESRNVIPEFEMAYYDAILSKMANEEPELARFDGDGHTRLVEEFREADLKRIRLARLEVAAAHHLGMPRQDGGAGPIGTLKGEFQRKRGHMPIRLLMKKAGTAIQAIKPVFMMSPLSVAQFLEPGAVEFDLLVIDEASQIQPVDALGAMARCRQMVIVGDDRQLPPTNFFNRMLSDDDGDDDSDDGSANVKDIESILGLCMSKGLPTRMLRWHYRSRHQSLIAVSNHQFYENRLYIVPSPYTKQAGMGLRFHHVPQATFDRGKSGINLEEAKIVAEAVLRHAHEHPDQSLGVATFSIRQRRAVLDELERLRRLNPDTEAFFTAHPAEPFFVKNLENIQGDERDVILISVGYGRDPQGFMSMNFGPLNRDGGERRLNVLISRAKERCEVYSSITDDDIDLERTRGRGVFALKYFLNFARTGKMGIGVQTDREHDSVFEEQVANALLAKGYDVHPQVGLAGFFIDLAIADFERPGRYILGIECDGASYHSSRSSRDRDRLRQAVLEDHGWIIHRIWSTDWFHRPQEQISKTIAAIEAAKAELDARGEKGQKNARAVPVEVITVEREDIVEIGLQVADDSLSKPYQEANVAVPLHTELHEVSSGIMADIVFKVVQAEGPIHGEEIIVRIRSFWGLQRAGTRIQGVVERGIQTALQILGIVEQGNFYSIANTVPTIRDRSAVSSMTLRKPEMLPPSEIKSAAVAFVHRNMGATDEEAVTGISRLFGFKSTSAQLKQILETAINGAIEEGKLVRQGGLLRKP